MDSHYDELAKTYPALQLARIVSQYNDIYKIYLDEIDVLAEVSGKYRHHASALEGFPTVGDYVMVKPSVADTDRMIIEVLLPRKSAFKRAAVGQDGQVQVIAANIDVLFICMALNEDYNLSRLERYLSIAWDSGARPAIVLTKADLCDDLTGVMQEVSMVAFGVDVFVTTLDDATSFGPLGDCIGADETASFVGSSGVGKSTIVNFLLGENVLDTADVRKDGKGRHTTTRRELFVLPDGGALIDTPGMRELGVDSADLTKSFSEIESLATQCRFNDCLHDGEPGCAVQNAIDEGVLDERRLASYRKLKKEARYEGLNAKQIEEEKIRSMVGGYGEMKKARDYARQKNLRR